MVFAILPPNSDAYQRYNDGCQNCHGSCTSNGYGLRAHHKAKGITTCSGCHPNDPAPKPENTLPVFYGKLTVNIKDPCNTDGKENWTSDGKGLDNDGDLLYDSNDTDCSGGATTT